LGVVALLSAIAVGRAPAQSRKNQRWEIRGFDFRKDGVLRPRARAVRANRARLLAARQFSALNQSFNRMAPSGGAAAPTATALTGVLNVPAILFRYKDSPAPTFTTTDYNNVLFGVTPTGIAAGRPYTYRSFYREMSDGLFDITGTTYGTFQLDSSEVYYTGGTSQACAGANPFGSSNCSGLFSAIAQNRMQAALREALIKLDGQIDFGQYAASNDTVPLVLFMHQAMGAECGPANAPENHLWAHRFHLTTPYQSQDNSPFHPGSKVVIDDYILQSGLGGANSCSPTPTQIMPIGTVAHETGHGFGLPDLYDTDGPTEGIGQWGLMSSGSFTSGLSPSRMEAWSLNELGWVTVAPLSTSGTFTFNAAPLSDTAFYVRVQGANPRGEYFLLENRQRQQSDSALIRIHCRQAGNPPGCGGGLLIWHVDSAQLAQGAPSNSVNSGLIHGLELMQADGFGNLDASSSGVNCPINPFSIFLGCSDRGDAGDVYPGATNNTAFVFRTTPAALKNFDGSFAGFGVDAITQVVPDNTMSFRIRFGGLTTVRASDPSAFIQFAGNTYNIYQDLLDQGGSYTVSFQEGHLSADGRKRFHFVSWSDGGAITHSYIGNQAGETLTATVVRDFKLIATSGTGGTVQADTAGVDLTAGVFIPDGRAVQLTATETSAAFAGWCGDTTSSQPIITLPMHRPYTVAAAFGPLTITTAPARPNGIMGASYADTLRTSAGACAGTWTLAGGALPQGLTLTGTGIISGYPRETGDFTFTAVVTAGTQTQNRTFTLSVSAPTLVAADVITQLLGPGAPLTADQIRYLDLLGNNNSVFDVGDFLAWFKTTGGQLSPAMLNALQKKGGRP
jgi:M6 family metalloprotease-like protein